MAKVHKTNAARILESAGIEYELVPYIVDESNLAAVHIAGQLGEDIDRVFKTLVLKGDKNGYLVCVIPGNCEVDLKKAAKVSGNKSVQMIPMKELLPVTGYIRGGCSPLGMKKAFPTWFHRSALSYKFIYVSGGMRGLQLKVNPQKLIEVTSAEVADIALSLE